MKPPPAWKSAAVISNRPQKRKAKASRGTPRKKKKLAAAAVMSMKHSSTRDHRRGGGSDSSRQQQRHPSNDPTSGSAEGPSNLQLSLEASSTKTPTSSLYREAGSTTAGYSQPSVDSHHKKKKKHNVFKKMHVFSVSSKNLAIILLQHPTKILIGGAVSVRALIGSVVVNGYHLLPPGGFVTTYSSSKFGYLPISTIAPKPPEDPGVDVSTRLSQALEQVGAQAMLGPVKQAYNNRCVMLALKKPSHILHITYATAIMNAPFFRLPTHPTVPPLERLGIEVHKLYGQARIIEPNSIQKELVGVLHDSINILQTRNILPAIIICGGKMVGKSTYLSYLMNCFLEKYESLYHLEMDPGQPEFTPPGCISLTKVTSPILGPSFTHQLKPETSVFLGQTNITKIGPTYHAAMLSLINYYSNHNEGKIPLFVNTMGWTTGLGYQFLIDLVRYVRPSHVIQLHLKNSAPALPRLSPTFLAEAQGWGSNSFKSTMNYSLLQLPSVHSKPFTEGVTLQQQRNLAICAYLGRLQTTSIVRPLTYFSSYAVKWSSLAVCFCNDVVSPQQIFQVLNASFVALCAVETEFLESSLPPAPDYPVLLAGCPVNECLGFGVIGRIDLTKQAFLIITPEPLPVLAQVNAIYHGQITLPDELLQNQDSDQNLPYLGKVSSTRRQPSKSPAPSATD